tara:strand:- start:23666 stop:24934 length:1269 start_codon:yes stop_codon:yes gene_type:complete
MNPLISSLVWQCKNFKVIRAYREIKKNQDNFDKFADKYLKKLLTHAKKNVPYYANIEIVDISSIDKLPIMTKDILRNSPELLISKDLGKRSFWYNTSGGSTGEPVRFIQDCEYDKWVSATLFYYFKELLKCDWSKSVIVDVWGSPEDYEKNTTSFLNKLRNLIGNNTFINAFEFGEKEMLDALNVINRKKPDILKGYSNSLYDLACFIENNKLNVYSPKLISARSSMLYSEQREKIEKVFNTKIYDFYGSREASAIAGQCLDSSSKMCIFQFNNIIEIVDGEILLTNLHNYSMPLIRYKIMDQANSISKKDNKLPFLDGLQGRTYDYFVLNGQRRIHVQYFISLFFYIDDLISFQIVQNEINQFTINYVAKSSMGLPERVKETIEEKMIASLGDNIEILWEKVDFIEKTINGKHLYARSEVK